MNEKGHSGNPNKIKIKRQMKRHFILLKATVFFLFAVGSALNAQTFDLVPLGVYGGGDESNLSAYLVAEKDQKAYLSLDAGTLRAGINKSIENGIFEEDAEYVLRNYIKGYFISHGHLDHLAGMIINSPDDNKKNIYALPFTIDILKNRYFTNDAWSNFANEGEEPTLGTYTYKRYKDKEVFEVEGTSLKAQIFKLSHINPYKSSALLVTNSVGESLLYFGDTGADKIEKTNKLEKIWTAVAPLIKDKTLKAILIETSFDNSRKDELLFGHLTPKLLNEELQVLAEKAEQKDLNGLKVIITHLKPGGDQIEKIKEQYQEYNPTKVDFIYPEQGRLLEL